MTPDKIYMPNELLSEEWQRHIEGEDTAYIRKDALLEFLRRAISCLPPYSESQFEKSLAIHNAIIYGQCTTMQIILEKIQSL